MTTPQPSTLLRSLHIRPATRADLPDIARLHADAFNTFEIYDWFMPRRHAYPEQFYRYCLMRDRLLFDSPDNRFLIAEAPRHEVERAVRAKKGVIGNSDAVTGTEAVHATADRRRAKLEGKADHMTTPKADEMVPLAFSCLEAMGDSALSRRWKADYSWDSWFDRIASQVERGYVRYFLNRVADYAAFDMLRSQFRASFTGIPGEVLLHIQFLITGPEYQGLGVGKALLREALDMGRREGLCVGLESSNAGKEFYKRNGFKITHEHVIEEWDAGKNRPTTRTPVMVWEPEDRRGQWLEEDGMSGWRIKGASKEGSSEAVAPLESEAGLGET